MLQHSWKCLIHEWGSYNGSLIHGATFMRMRGVTRNSLSFNDIISLRQGSVITRVLDNRFFKSMVNLSITIKSANVTIEFKPHKQLVGNIYQPITIFKPKVNSSVVKFMFYIKKAIKFCSRLIHDINETYH